MADISKISPDDGSTILNIKDGNAVHWGGQSKGYVGKNLFKNTGESKTSNNVVFTHNADDSIGLNNTASATTFYTIGSVASLAGINQNVILSGCPEGGDTNNGYSMGIRTTSNKNVRHENIDIVDTGNGFRFNPSNPLKDSDGNSVSISDLVLVMRIGNGVNVSDKTFYPMIRLASISDSTYEPYLTPNTEIDNKMTYADNAVLGAKNFFNNTATTQTIDNVTFTVNANKSITVVSEGATTSDVTIALNPSLAGIARNVKFKFSANGNVALTTGRIYIVRFVNSVRSDVTAPINGDVDITFGANDDIRMVNLIVPNGATINTTFYPMIRLASDVNDTYAMYSMTNFDLTPRKDVVSLESGITKWTENVLVKHAKTVLLNLSVSGTFTANTETLVGTIPNGYRPSQILFFPLGTTVGYGYAKFGQDGTIKVTNNANVSNININAFWQTP